MALGFLAGFAVKGALVLAGGALGARLLARRSAALRHLHWSLVLAAALLVGPLSYLLPRLEVSPPLARELFQAEAGGRGELPQGWPDVATLPAASTPAARDRALRLAGRLVIGLWAAGTFLLLARTAAGRWRLCRLRAGARPAPAWIAAEAAELARAAGCRRPVALLVDPRIATPAAFGVLRPALALPPACAAWPAATRRLVLLHELAHLARRDPATQLLAELACAVHWFDPLAWHAARRLAEERERACDDRVLAAGAAPAAYAGAIVELARELGRGPAAAGALGMGFDQLATRLRALLDPGVARALPSRRERLRVGAVLALLAGVVAALGAAPPTVSALPFETAIDHPLSELVPAGNLRALWPSAAEVRSAPDRAAIERLQAAAAHVKTWEGDLVRERAEWALAQVRGGEVVRPLVAALGDPDWRVQAYAAWGLAVAGDARGVEPVRDLLDHPVWRVRAQAVQTLRHLGAEVPVEALERLAADPAWQVRIGVVELLERDGGSGEARRLAVLRKLAADPHGGTRTTAQAALAGAR
ncbi:MAG TPA: M56 family metallopeptidase [Thermoanaerobaculia bacterium]|nr:M56 family metallopeptidase [Thermoanaerobaculia bacterium]